jgi:hypothetical protein
MREGTRIGWKISAGSLMANGICCWGVVIGVELAALDEGVEDVTLACTMTGVAVLGREVREVLQDWMGLT